MKAFITIFIVGALLVSGTSIAQEKKEGKTRYKSLSRRDMQLERSVPELLAEAQTKALTAPEASLALVEEALALSITQKSSFNEAKCYMLLGYINEGIGEWELAVINYLQAYQRLTVTSSSRSGSSYSSTEEYFRTLTGLGRAYNQLGQHEKALDYLTQLLPDTRRFSERHQTTLLELADTYFHLGRYEEALARANEGEALAEKSRSPEALSQAKAIKAKVLAQMNELEDAEELYQQSQSYDFAIEEEPAIQSKNTLQSTREELINVYRSQNRVDDELELRNQSVEKSMEVGDQLGVSKERQAIGKVLIEQGRTAEAIRQLEKAAHLADSLGNTEQQVNVYQALAEAYRQAGKTTNALTAYSRFSEASDVLREENLKKQQQRTELIRKQSEIEAMTKELALDDTQYELGIASDKLIDSQLFVQKLIIYGLTFMLMLAVIGSFLILRNARHSKRMSQLLALKSLRSQMNPHFIFNALNSVNQFIALNDERSANKFLSEFSRLMRLVLDNSQKDFITLLEEKEILTLYLKLEHYRFRDKFDYAFHIDDDIEMEAVEIPPMLIQPYIENAVWHGLRYKEGKGHLDVSFTRSNGELLVTVQDDGIGREQSRAVKTANQQKHNSTGIKNIRERINIINRVYNKKLSVDIHDLNGNETGTSVVIHLPTNGINGKS